MLIKEWMSSPVITIDSEDSLTDAMKLFQTRVISMLPVLKNGKLAGILTDGDVKKATPSDATTLDKFEMPHLLSSLKIDSIMSKSVITTHMDHTVDESAGIMLKNSISGLPVLDGEGSLEGIITKSDVFRCFVSFTGVSSTGQTFVFKLPDRPGVIKNITGDISNNNGRLRNIMTSYDDIGEGLIKVYLHTYRIDSSKFDSLVERFKETGGLLYAADLSKGFRKIY